MCGETNITLESCKVSVYFLVAICGLLWSLFMVHGEFPPGMDRVTNL